MVHIVKVTYSNKDTVTTPINGTIETVKDYFAIGKVFNIGSGENDLMACVEKLEFLTVGE